MNVIHTQEKKKNFHYNLNSQPIFNTTLINNNPSNKNKNKNNLINLSFIMYWLI